MAYSKQNFQNGQILNAANLEKMENGIIAGQGAHNLLDNSDFSNPIAQAGLNGMHGSMKYVCDRWISWDADATFGSGYITPGSPIDQRLSKKVIDINKTYTAAICLSDGTIKADYGTFSNGFGSYALGIYCMKQEDSNDHVAVRLSTGNNIRWAALYEGAYTAETLPTYVPKGKHVEMLNCGVSLAPHNLLDNSDFSNPVNQRGQSSYSGTGGKVYTIDRWHTWSASISVSVQSGYLSVTNSTDSIYQNISQIIDKHNLTNKAATIAVWDAAGNVYCASGVISTNNEISCNTPTDFWFSAILEDDNTIYFAIRPRGAKTAKLKAAALYEGFYDASTLPAYQPKGYAAELAECQRYFTRVGNSAAYGIISGTGCVVKVPLPMTMRKGIVPTVTLDSSLWAYSHEGYVGLTFIGTTYSTNTASLHFTLGTETSARCCVVPDLSFNISADL